MENTNIQGGRKKLARCSYSWYIRGGGVFATARVDATPGVSAESVTSHLS